MKYDIRVLEYGRSRQRIRHAWLIRLLLNIKEYSDNKIIKGLNNDDIKVDYDMIC